MDVEQKQKTKKQMRTMAEWCELLQDWRMSGLNPSAWCRLRGITRSVWARWRQRLEGDADTERVKSVVSRGFIPVRMTGSDTRAPATVMSGTGMQMEITLKSGHRIQVHGLRDQQLTTLVQQLLM